MSIVLWLRVLGMVIDFSLRSISKVDSKVECFIITIVGPAFKPNFS